MSNQELNSVKTRFLPIPESAAKGLEPEPKISDFTILKELGAGSFGHVYLVQHKVTKAQYAIKAIDKRNKTNQEEKTYFRREVEVMYKIHHPNVVKLFGHFEDNNYCYFIMEYISKGSIFSLIPNDKKKRINAQVVASLIKDIISAVYFLHNMNPIIIHRDIKPENVLLSEDFKAKLTDFGWSNYIQDDAKRTTVCGTPIYLAPEIIKEEGHDEKVDIWCIGVLLFELSTGSVPFMGNDIETLKKNILNLKITWPKDINTEAKGLISKILKLDPKTRCSLADMIKHPFITKYFPNAPKECLIKPDLNAEYRPFIVSKDDPKNWNPIVSSKQQNELVKNVTSDEPTKEMYQALIEKYEKLQKEFKSAQEGSPSPEEIQKIKNTLKEKEEQMANLVSLQKKDGEENGDTYLKMRCDELEKSNNDLKEKLSRYKEYLKDKKGEEINNKLNVLRDSMKGKDQNSINSAVEGLKAQLNNDSKNHLNQIIKEKEKEIERIKEEEKIRREKEKKKYTIIINKYDKTLSHFEKENKELKARLKELQAKK